MKQSEQARRETILNQEKNEQKLVQGEQQDGHWPDGQHAPVKDQGFDRTHQGAPRADDRSSYKGQSAYGSLEAANARGGVSAPSEQGSQGEQSEPRGGVSRYGNNLGSRFALDQEPGTSQRTAAPLSRPGFAPGAAPQSTDVGQYAGEYDDAFENRKTIPGVAGSESGAGFTLRDKVPAKSASGAALSGDLRGDEQLKEEIHERLIEHPDLDIHDVSVALHEGHAILEGSVPDAHMKAVIVELVDNVSGVLKIDDRIIVQHVNPANHTTAQAYAVGTEVTDDLQHSGPLTFGAASARASAMKEQQAAQSGTAQGREKEKKS